MPKEQYFFNQWRLGLIGVFLLSVIVYLPSMGGAAIWDDDLLISGKMFGANTVASAFTHPFGVYYRPLTSLSFVIDTSYAKGIPFLYHQTNILFHALTAVLVSCLAFLLTEKKAAGFLAGILFAFQPLQVGAVAWIGGRTDVLSTFFLVAFLLTLVRYHQTSKLPWLIASAFLYLIAAMSKEQAAAVLPAVPISVFAIGSKKWKDVGRVCTPFGVALAVYVVLWRIGAPAPHVVHAGLVENLNHAMRAMSFYAVFLFAPNHTSLMTYTLENSAGPLWVSLGVACYIGIGAFLWVMWRRHRAVALVAICGLLVYLPVANFFPAPSVAVGPYRVAESGGFAACILGMAAAYAISNKQLILAALVAANSVDGMAVTWWGVHQWQNTIGMFTQIDKNDPHFPEGVYLLTIALSHGGKAQEAVKVSDDWFSWLFGTDKWAEQLETKHLAALTPEVQDRLVEIGNIPNTQTLARYVGAYVISAIRAGHPDQARHAANAALVLSPNDASINFLSGRLVRGTDRKKAIQFWEKAIAEDPKSADCAAALAHERIIDGRYSEAVKLLNVALSQLEYSGSIWLDLADAQIGLHDYPAARQSLDKADHAVFAAPKAAIEARLKRIQANELLPR